MNKVITDIRINNRDEVTQVTYNPEVITPVLLSLERNGTFCPNIQNVVVNGPVTKMFFVDGTSVTVKVADGYKRDQNGRVVKDKNGKPVTIGKPDPQNLDAAIAFCVFKRIFGRPDANGEIQGGGFSSFLKKTILNKVFDQGKHDAEVARLRAEKKALKRKLKNDSKCESGCSKCTPAPVSDECRKDTTGKKSGKDCCHCHPEKKHGKNVKRCFGSRGPNGKFVKR